MHVTKATNKNYFKKAGQGKLTSFIRLSFSSVARRDVILPM